MRALRVESNLPPDLEALIQRVIGALIAVHSDLGPGMSERVYAAAAQMELAARGIAFESEKPFPVRYRGRFLCHQRIDLFIEGLMVVEIKSVEALHPAHRAQVVSYLRLTGARAGLLVNFNVPLLKHGIRRIVL